MVVWALYLKRLSLSFGFLYAPAILPKFALYLHGILQLYQSNTMCDIRILLRPNNWRPTHTNKEPQ
jgi:hypothetical protein